MKGRVGSKGELFIPKKIRDALGLKPGSIVEYELTEKGLLIKKKYSLSELLKLKPLITIEPGEEDEEMKNEFKKSLNEA